MKKIKFFLLLAVLFLNVIHTQAQHRIVIPDLIGYKTLKCDFHMHTIFSDGMVWPAIRVDEAVREGLDAISITEHVEPAYRKKEVVGSQNRPYEIAQEYAGDNGLIIIRGGEITRATSPWHSNAIFLSDVDGIVKTDYIDAYRAAKEQNAFIFWNHPGRPKDQPDTTLWWPEHALLFEQGMMRGIEVVNGNNYYPEAHRWCLEKKLTMIGNSDIHAPMPPFAPGQHRTMTLVFARERTEAAIREALNERRTAVYWKEFLIGEEKYLKELFENALEITVTKTDNTANIRLINKSDLTFYLKKDSHDRRLTYFRNISLEPVTVVPQGTLNIAVRLNDGLTGGDVNFIVENFITAPEKGMKYTISIK